eukprot:4205350-Pleurochrysis_carterae.AAC.3
MKVNPLSDGPASFPESLSVLAHWAKQTRNLGSENETGSHPEVQEAVTVSSSSACTTAKIT